MTPGKHDSRYKFYLDGLQVSQGSIARFRGQPRDDPVHLIEDSLFQNGGNGHKLPSSTTTKPFFSSYLLLGAVSFAVALRRTRARGGGGGGDRPLLGLPLLDLADLHAYVVMSFMRTND